jgi:hypothetical protein
VRRRFSGRRRANYSHYNSNMTWVAIMKYNTIFLVASVCFANVTALSIALVLRWREESMFAKLKTLIEINRPDCTEGAAASSDLLRQYWTATLLKPAMPPVSSGASGGSPALSNADAEVAAVNNPVTVRTLDEKEIAERMEASFDSDQRDPRWSVRDQKDGKRRLGEMLPEGSSLQSFECRASLCRIETTHEDAIRYDSFVKAAFLDPATHMWNTTGYVTRLGGDTSAAGPIRTVAYVAREGHGMPDLSLPE